VGVGETVEVTEDLLELGYGEYEGRTTADVRKERPGWDLWKDGSPGGESLEDAAARVDRVIERALAVDGDVACFAHGHILRIVGARWIGLEPAAAACLGLGTAALCDLGFERERRVIWLWNDTSHA
jgi:probable phosphoglycerate mutase